MERSRQSTQAPTRSIACRKCSSNVSTTAPACAAVADDTSRRWWATACPPERLGRSDDSHLRRAPLPRRPRTGYLQRTAKRQEPQSKRRIGTWGNSPAPSEFRSPQFPDHDARHPIVERGDRADHLGAIDLWFAVLKWPRTELDELLARQRPRTTSTARSRSISRWAANAWRRRPSVFPKRGDSVWIDSNPQAGREQAGRPLLRRAFDGRVERQGRPRAASVRESPAG